MNLHSLCLRYEYPATNDNMGRSNSAARCWVAGRERAIGRRKTSAKGFISSLGMLEVKYVCHGETPHALASP